MISLYKKIIPNSSEHVTIELREVVKDTDIFDRCDPFPIWDENVRGELEKKIIEHYYFRQIGFETVGRFVFKLNERLRLIMPRINKIYLTTVYKYNPIENYNMEEEGTDTRTASNETLSKYSETPPSELKDFKDGKYLTSVNHAEDENTGTDTHTFTRHGNIGVTSTQQLIEMERKITVDMFEMVISELKDLFLGVY